MKKIKNNFPINEFLISNSRKNTISFHMPGHNRGKGLDKNLLKYDITEIEGADNYHNPNGIISNSLKLISEKEKCIKSFFIVNGSSLAIQSVLKYVALQKGVILVTRDCHKSVINSAILFNVDTVFAFNKYDNEINILLPITLDEIKEKVEKNKKIKFVILTSPNYYGMVANIEKISNYLHRKKIILIVDQAHGSHFIHSELLPKGAIKCNADIIIESTHKTLASINQSALLHINNSAIDISDMQFIINSLTTTSPSYMMMATIEKVILSNYSKQYNNLYRNIEYLKRKIQLPIINNDDFTRIVISFKNTSLTGYEVKRILSKNNIEIEMADLFNIVLISVPFNKRKEFRKLIKVINNLDIKTNQTDQNITIPLIKKSISINKAYSLKRKNIDLDKANGHICGTIVVSYPPGIPLLYWGEVIDINSINFIKEIQKNNGEVIGVNNNMIEVIDD